MDTTATKREAYRWSIINGIEDGITAFDAAKAT
jgi:hypothetical protein